MRDVWDEWVKRLGGEVGGWRGFVREASVCSWWVWLGWGVGICGGVLEVVCVYVGVSD